MILICLLCKCSQFFALCFRWFRLDTNPHTGKEDWIFTNDYWHRKWDRCPDIFQQEPTKNQATLNTIIRPVFYSIGEIVFLCRKLKIPRSICPKSISKQCVRELLMEDTTKTISIMWKHRNQCIGYGLQGITCVYFNPW